MYACIIGAPELHTDLGPDRVDGVRQRVGERDRAEVLTAEVVQRRAGDDLAVLAAHERVRLVAARVERRRGGDRLERRAGREQALRGEVERAALVRLVGVERRRPGKHAHRAGLDVERDDGALAALDRGDWRPSAPSGRASSAGRRRPGGSWTASRRCLPARSCGRRADRCIGAPARCGRTAPSRSRPPGRTAVRSGSGARSACPSSGRFPASRVPSAARITPRLIRCSSSTTRLLLGLSRNAGAPNTAQRELNAISTAKSTTNSANRRKIGAFTRALAGRPSPPGGARGRRSAAAARAARSWRRSRSRRRRRTAA